jgi:hypothetical protein
MSELQNGFLLGAIDTDAAIGEAAAEIATDTRSGFLRRACLAGAAMIGGGAFLGALPTIADAATLPASDIAILNFALTLEYLEAAFYAQAVAGNALSDPGTIRFASVVSQHEADHVAFLKGVLGSKAVASPTFNFQGTTANQALFQATADALENTGVHAYIGQVANIKTPAVLLGAGRILAIEARHAAWIRDIRFAGGASVEQTPAPAAFEDGFTMAAILATVKATGFITTA